MKDTTGTVVMSGEKMEVLLEAGCVTNWPLVFLSGGLIGAVPQQSL